MPRSAALVLLVGSMFRSHTALQHNWHERLIKPEFGEEGDTCAVPNLLAIASMRQVSSAQLQSFEMAAPRY